MEVDMYKIQIAVFVLMFLIPSVVKSQDAKQEKTIKNNSEIKIVNDSAFSIIPGKYIVFQHQTYKPGERGVFEGYFRSDLIWQIDPKNRSFTLRNKELENARMYYYVDCHCAEKGFHPVKQGSVSGRRITSDSWIVKVDIVYTIPNGTKYNIIYESQVFDKKPETVDK
jgi:hypothetical protein